MCETSLGALFIVDDAGRHVRINESAARLLGAPREKILGRRIEQFTPPEHCARLDELSVFLRERGSLEGHYELLRGNGTRTWVRFRARWMFAAGKHLISAAETGRPDSCRAAGQTPALTPREAQVLQLTSYGHSTREIAGALVISRATVKTHLEQISEKLEAHDRAWAVATALMLGLIS